MIFPGGGFTLLPVLLLPLHMKKLITLIALLLLPFAAGYAQEDREPVYFYVTSKGENNVSEGFRRVDQPNNSHLYNWGPINFTYLSDAREIYLMFFHVNYNTYELSKTRPVEWDDTLEIRTETASFLDNNYIIDLDELFESMSKEEIWEYFENLRGKKVYFIDKNPQFNHITSQTVKLIQVKPTISNRPQNNILFE